MSIGADDRQKNEQEAEAEAATLRQWLAERGRTSTASAQQVLIEIRHG